MSQVYVVCPEKLGEIKPELYGHFSEHIGGVFYDGLWVGKNSEIPNVEGFRMDMVDKLRRIHPPVLRWPGGCFAETYSWRDGIGENRPTRINWWTRNDGRYEPNEVGTYEFVTLCNLIGAKPYFAMNITSTTPMDARNWMDYCMSPEGTTSLAAERAKNGSPAPFDIPYWGVGNENWGGGGNMTPGHYADEYRRYATVMQNSTMTNPDFFVCGANAFDYAWTRGVLDNLKDVPGLPINGMAVHYYCGSSGTALKFDGNQWDELICKAKRMEEIVTRHYAIIEGYGLGDRCKLVVDEWGCWHPEGSGPSKGYNLFEQQSTMRDAVVAALTLNIFNNHCDKVKMANVAQLTNNLHCLFLSGGKNVITTPTYHIFDMYQTHQGGEALRTIGEDRDISVSASVKNHVLTLTAANLSCREDKILSLKALGGSLAEKGKKTVLTADAMNAHNSFEKPECVKPVTVDFNPEEEIELPRYSALSLRIPLNQE